MKRNLPFANIFKNKIKELSFISILLIASTFLYGQQVIDNTLTINKTIVKNNNECNQFNVELSITGTAPDRPIEVMLVIDVSGSMDDDIPNDPKNSLEHAQDAALDFISNIFSPANNPTGNNKVGIVTYSTNATLETGLISDQNTLNTIINGLSADGWTNISEGIDFAANELNNNATHDCITMRSIIVLTDGVANRRANSNEECTTWPTAHTNCTNAAITSGINAQDFNGYQTNVFTTR